MSSEVLCRCGCGGLAPIAKKNDRANGLVKGAVLPFIQRHHLRNLTREKTSNWKGGKFKFRGYVMVLSPGHPRARKNGYAFEHILMAERALRRPLPEKAVVHHHDEIRDHNVPGNLVICEDAKYHQALHQRMRAMKACGNPNARACRYCGRYDRQEEISIYTYKNGWISGQHRACHAARQLRRWKLKQQERQAL